jgi:hypothetical protein
MSGFAMNGKWVQPARPTQSSTWLPVCIYFPYGLPLPASELPLRAQREHGCTARAANAFVQLDARVHLFPYGLPLPASKLPLRAKHEHGCTARTANAFPPANFTARTASKSGSSPNHAQTCTFSLLCSPSLLQTDYTGRAYSCTARTANAFIANRRSCTSVSPAVIYCPFLGYPTCSTHARL